jgi:hypothetical protein
MTEPVPTEPTEGGEPTAPATPSASGGTNPNPAPAAAPEPVVPPAPEGGQPVPTEPTPTEPVPTEPTEPAVSEVQFKLPGGYQEESTQALDWYKQNYGQVAAQLAAAQQQLEQYQYAGLDDAEAAQQRFQVERQRWQQQMSAWQEAQAKTQWADYWAQFSETPEAIRAMQDPIQMGHTVTTTLYQQLQQAQAEVAALKKAASQPPAGPPVTEGAQGGAGTRNLFDLTDKEREDLWRKGRMGHLKDADIPSL